MGTPLSNLFRKRQKFTLKSDAFLGHKKPIMAQAICTVFALAAEIDHLKAELAVRLLDGEQRASLQMLRKLKSTREVAISAVIDAKLPKEVSRLYQRALAAGEKFDEHRNRFAHWLWADCEELPNRACFIDPWVPMENWVDFHENLLSNALLARSKSKAAADAHTRLRETETYRANTVTYDITQLGDVISMGIGLWSILMEFSSLSLKTQQSRQAEIIASIETRLQNLEAQKTSATQSAKSKSARRATPAQA